MQTARIRESIIASTRFPRGSENRVGRAVLCAASFVDPIGTFYDISPQGQVVWIELERGTRELWLMALERR